VIAFSKFSDASTTPSPIAILIQPTHHPTGTHR
jgi:hypothetical protein